MFIFDKHIDTYKFWKSTSNVYCHPVLCYSSIENFITVPDATIYFFGQKPCISCEKCKKLIPIKQYHNHYVNEKCVEILTVGDILFRDFVKLQSSMILILIS